MFTAGFTEELPICSVCNKPVKLESAKTDEDGQAVHEDCYWCESASQRWSSHSQTMLARGRLTIPIGPVCAARRESRLARVEQRLKARCKRFRLRWLKPSPDTRPSAVLKAEPKGGTGERPPGF